MAGKFFDSWQLWQRGIFTTGLSAVGVIIGFTTAEGHLSPAAEWIVGALIVGFVDFMFLIVRPRVLAKRRTAAAD
jgi:hypothetical protein